MGLIFSIYLQHPTIIKWQTLVTTKKKRKKEKKKKEMRVSCAHVKKNHKISTRIFKF